jgi:hypothetical protein
MDESIHKQESVQNITSVTSADELYIKEVIRSPLIFKAKSNFKVLKMETDGAMIFQNENVVF